MSAQERAAFDGALDGALRGLGVHLTCEQCDALWRHRLITLDANQRFNLTRITAPGDFAVKHHADSLAVVAWSQQHARGIHRVLDVGTGAGVPGVPLAIAQPDWEVVAIDGTRKKAQFVAEIALALGLRNLTALHARAESWRGGAPFDLVLFKAVADWARCLGFARPHLRGGGHAVVFKTESDRVADSRQNARDLIRGFTQCAPFAYRLSLGNETFDRSLWIFQYAGN